MPRCCLLDSLGLLCHHGGGSYLGLCGGLCSPHSRLGRFRVRHSMRPGLLLGSFRGQSCLQLHEAAGGLDGAYGRLEQASAQYKWSPLRGGDEPRQIRKKQGGRSLIQDPDYAGTMSDDVSWLRRVVVPAMPQATLWALDWGQIAFTTFIYRFIIKHLTMSVDSQGTPFFIDHIRLCFMQALFESSWRPRVRLAADSRPVSFVKRPGTYMVSMLW